MLKDIELDKIRSILNRDPNNFEFAMFDVMWSEHCSYKSSKHWFKLFDKVTTSYVKLGIGEGAGLIDVGDGQIIGIALESHNHPSAIDPFNGAATGVGGIIRDVLSQGCHPIALLDSLRFGELNNPHTQFLFENVIYGISSYGNCVGVPNIGGDIVFDESYTYNCLVNVMCIGLAKESDIVRSIATTNGDYLILFGASTGRDGIGGVSFASKDLTDNSHEDRPAVQIGDPAQEKVLIDVVHDLIDENLVKGMQDLGGGGLTCACSEIVVSGGKGAKIFIETVPRREIGMDAWEVMLSESQERMLIVISPQNLSRVIQILDLYEVHHTKVGEVIDEDRLIVINNNEEILVDIPASLLVNGFVTFDHARKVPEYIQHRSQEFDLSLTFNDCIDLLLKSPTIGSKAVIYEQYDKTVQSRTIMETGTNAGVLDIGNGKAVGAVLDTNDYQIYLNPRIGTLSSVLRCCGKLFASGLEPIALVDCLNFGNPEKPDSYWQFVESIHGLAEAVNLLQLPVVGGNVSLYNENESDKRIKTHPTSTIGILGLTRNYSCILSHQFKKVKSKVILVGNSNFSFKGSELSRLVNPTYNPDIENPDIRHFLRIGQVILKLARKNIVSTCKHISRGGLYITLIQMLCETNFGLKIVSDKLRETNPLKSLEELFFGETIGSYVVEVNNALFADFQKTLIESGIQYWEIGELIGRKQLIIDNVQRDLTAQENKWKNVIISFFEA